MSNEQTEEERQIEELQEKRELKKLLENSDYYYEDRYKIGFQDLVAIIKDITRKAGYGTVQTFAVTDFTYEN